MSIRLLSCALALVLLAPAARAADLADRVQNLMKVTKVVALEMPEDQARRHVADGKTDTIEIIKVTTPAQGTGWVSADGEMVVQYRESPVTSELLLKRAYLLRALNQLEVEGKASGGVSGFGPWTFGMSRAEVKAQTLFAPYYDFQNGDVGTAAWPLANGNRPVSFYFNQDRMTRVLLILYLGQERGEIELAWTAAHEQLTKRFGQVELRDRQIVDAEAALKALQGSGLFEGTTGQFQMAAYPRPPRRDVWVTAKRMEDGRTMVSMTIAQPQLPVLPAAKP